MTSRLAPPMTLRLAPLVGLLLVTACTLPGRASSPAQPAPTAWGWQGGAAPGGQPGGGQPVWTQPSGQGGGGAPAAAPPAGGEAALEAQVLVEVNARRQRGATCGGKAFGAAPALQAHAALAQAARGHSADMAARNYFDHTSPDGRKVVDRLRAAGYRGATYGENIAAGRPTAASVVDQWMNSPPHSTNIMDRDFRFMGVGHAERAGTTYTHYWTQDFGA